MSTSVQRDERYKDYPFVVTDTATNKYAYVQLKDGRLISGGDLPIDDFARILMQTFAVSHLSVVGAQTASSIEFEKLGEQLKYWMARSELPALTRPAPLHRRLAARARVAIASITGG